MAASADQSFWRFGDRGDITALADFLAPVVRRSALYLRGAATVIGLPRLASRLAEIPPKTDFHVHLDELDYIDHACLELIANYEKQHELTGGKLYVDWEGLEARFRDRGRSSARVQESAA